MTSRPLRLLFLGLDGADARVVRRLAACGRLPVLARLAASGLLVPVRSTIPAATSPAWATCLTGVGPGRHGVFDFTRPDGYSLRFGTPRPAHPTWLETLSAAGLRVGAIGFPGRLHGDGLSGFLVAGWDTPLDTAAGRRHVRPPALLDRIRSALGPEALAFAALDEFARDGADPHEAVRQLHAAARARVDLALFLAHQTPVDVLAVHFQALDTAGHHLWPRSGEPGTWADDDTGSPPLPAALVAVYRAVDRAVGDLVQGLEPRRVVVVSDHGMGPTSDRVVSLNALLVAGGFQQPMRAALLPRFTRWARHTALGTLPAPLRSLAFRTAGLVLPGAVEALSRYADIDLAASRAFSDELTYAPSVRLNVRGREPLGPVEPADRRRVAEDVVDWLGRARRPDGGRLFAAVHRREEVYDGPFVERAPDVVCELAEDADGRMPVLCPPHLRGALGGAWHIRVPPGEHAGRKGGLLRGCHRPDGILLASPAPPAAFPTPHDLRDVAPLVFDLLGRTAARGTGRSRVAALPADAPSAAPEDEGLNAAEQRALARRLRALGYLEDSDP